MLGGSMARLDGQPRRAYDRWPRASTMPRSETFYQQDVLREALAVHDFAPVFRAVRADCGLTQEELGSMIGLSQARGSAVEAGRHRLRDIGVVIRIAKALAIPARLLGFRGRRSR